MNGKDLKKGDRCFVDDSPAVVTSRRSYKGRQFLSAQADGDKVRRFIFNGREHLCSFWTENIDWGVSKRKVRTDEERERFLLAQKAVDTMAFLSSSFAYVAPEIYCLDRDAMLVLAESLNNAVECIKGSEDECDQEST